MTYRIHVFASVVCIAASLSLCSVASAQPAFDDNKIAFMGIPNSADYTVNAAAPTLTKLPNGFTVAYSYTLTVVNVAEIDTTWSAGRDFSLPAAANLAVRINGSTSLTEPANSTLQMFLVDGAIINGGPMADFTTSNIVGPQNAKAITWDMTSEFKMMAANNNNGYAVELLSGPDWIPTAVGQQLQFSSEYTVTVVPEPHSVILMGLGAGLVGLSALRRRRTRNRR
jgi:hypothetical protein